MNGLIWDFEEKYPLKLSASVMKMCGGYRVKNLKVTEVRQVVHQRMIELK